jgi:serine O-acetyltransferase
MDDSLVGGLHPGQPVIGDAVTLLDTARVFGPVTIGDRFIIGTNAVVVDDVPPDTVVYGARKSHTMRPLSELGLAERAGAEVAYRIAGRHSERADRGAARAGADTTGET